MQDNEGEILAKRNRRYQDERERKERDAEREKEAQRQKMLREMQRARETQVHRSSDFVLLYPFFFLCFFASLFPVSFHFFSSLSSCNFLLSSLFFSSLIYILIEIESSSLFPDGD